MKHTKILIAVVLLFALLLSSCGQAAPQAAETVRRTVKEAPAPAAAGRVELLSAYHEAPAAGTFALPLSAPGQVTPTTVEHNTMFRAKFEGNAVSGRGEVVDGVYRFAADKTDGESWHVKLECNYPTVAGRDYRVTYRFRSDVAGKVKFGDFQEFDIHEGENSVTGVLIATSGTSYLDLQLGMLPAFTIDFTEIEIEEYADEVDYENALSVPVNFEKESLVWEKHDQGYAPVLTRSRDEVTVDYLATSWDNGVWKSRLYIKTGMIPESGVHYRVTADVTCDQDLPFEVLLNNGEEEKGYGALYGQNAAAGKTMTCESVITGSSEGDELIMQFSLGDAPEGSAVKIGNLHVEKIKDHYSSVLPPLFALDTSVETGKMLYGAIPTSFKNVPLSFSYSGTDTVFEGHDDGYEVGLEESASSATLKITKAPASDRRVFKVKLFAATGVTLEAGTTYRIKFDLASTGDQAEYEVLFSGDTETAYGALYSRSLTAGGTDAVEYTVTPDASHGPLTLLFQLGKTDTTAGNTVTLSGLTVEKLSNEFGPATAVPCVGDTGGNVWGETNGDYELTVSADGSTATAGFTTAPASGDLWNAKLFINTGVTLEASSRYRVSAKMTGTQAISEFEIVCDNGGTENGYSDGKQTGLVLPANTETVFSKDFSTPDSGCGELVLRFQLGKTPANNTVTVSSLEVRKITSTGDTPDELSGFAYPVTSGGETIPGSYVQQAVNVSASAFAGDGSAATASASSGTATLNVSQARNPGVGGKWSTRLEANTGVTLENGVKYKVSGTITSEKPFNSEDDYNVIEVLYSNGVGTDEGGHNPGGQGYGGGTWGLKIPTENGSVSFEKEFTVPELSEYRPLYLRIQVGNGEAPNTITVSNIKVEKWVPEHEAGGETTPNSFTLTKPEGNDAALTGDGSSGTVSINTPATGIVLSVDTGATLEAGKKYQITLSVEGADWDILFARDGGEENEFGGTITFDNPLKNVVEPTTGGKLKILLKFDRVSSAGSVKISGITITELGTETQGDNLMTAALATKTLGNVSLGAVETGYNTSLSVSSGAANVTINAVPADGREPWKDKVFLNTGIVLEAGKAYRVSADVASTVAMSYEVTYNGSGEGDLGRKDNVQASAAASTVSNVITAGSDVNLTLQFNLGNAPSPCTVTISNVKVEESLGETAQSVLPSFSYDSVGYVSRAADDGYVTLLEQGSSSATLHILQAPASDRNFWNVKFNVKTGFTPEKNKGYRVSYDLTAAKAQSAFEVFYDGNTESAYGAQYAQSLSSGKNSFAYIIYPGESKGELVLQLRCGKTDGTDGNTYTFSNLKIEECTFRYTQTPEVKKVTTLDTQNGYIEQLDVTRDKATVRIEKTPATGREAWKSKLFVETGVTLNPGQKYRVSMDVRSIIPAPFEVCFNNGGVEKGLGAIFGLISTPAGQHVEYVTYAKEATQLVIQLSLGNCSPPNSIILSNVKVEKAGAIDLVSDTIYTF